uniref:DUF6534 domain-containing protein n=1 Tax=Psilocybe cubensis TaxID=181762 RepID=A0A8H8CLG8_PSICU
MQSVQSFTNRAGPQLLSGFGNIFLLGVLTVQVFIYHTVFHHDRLVIRVLIYSVYILESLQTVLLIRDLFRNFAEGFADPESLDQIGLLWVSIPLINGIVTFICQGLYAYRIHILFAKRILAGVVVLGCFVQLITSIILSVECQKNTRLSELFSPNLVLISGIWYSSSAICDVVIALSLTYYFFRKQTPKDARNKLTIQKIARITIGTGALTGSSLPIDYIASTPNILLIYTQTATTAILCCVLNFIPSKPAYYQTSTAILGKLYSNSMLVLLNSRMSMSEFGGDAAWRERYVMSSIEFRDLPGFEQQQQQQGRRGSRGRSSGASPGSGSVSGMAPGEREEERNSDFVSSIGSHQDGSLYDPGHCVSRV